MQGQMTRPTDPTHIAHVGTPNEMWWDVTAQAWVKAPIAPSVVNIDVLVAAYTAIRNARSAAKAAFDKKDAELEDDMAKLRAVILAQMNASGATSIKTEHGTAYRTLKTKPSAADWSAIYSWIKEDPERFELLEKRLKPTFINQYMEEHDGAIPPGINVLREYEVAVRKT